jgi:hypothetical protein
MSDDLWPAMHMLHEQAHGETPLQTCTQEPCRTLRHDSGYGQAPGERTFGPAPLSPPIPGKDH